MAQNAALSGAQFRDFSGGLVDGVDALNLQQNQSPDLLNVVVDEPQGSLKPRAGTIQCGVTPSGSAATALYEYFKADGTRRLIVSDNSTVWQTADCLTFTTIASNLSATNIPRFSIVRDKLWIVNGSTWPITWDGTTAKQLDGTAVTPNPPPPACRYIEFWKERVWCARTPSSPSAIAYSALTDSSGNDIAPSTGTSAWPALNSLQIDQDGGSPIFAIKAFRDRLYAFKNNGIWRVIFNSDFDIQVVKTLSSVGTRFQSSVTELDGFLYFVGPDGIYAFDGDNSVRISDPIQNKFLSISQPLSNEQFKLWTTDADFGAGTLSSVSTGTYADSIVLTPSTTTAVLYDDFSTDLTASPAWTQTAGHWSTTTANSYTAVWTTDGGYAEGGGGQMTAPSYANYGKWTMGVFEGAAIGLGDDQQYFEYRFINNGSDYYSVRLIGQSHIASRAGVKLIQSVGGVETVLSYCSQIYIPLSSSEAPQTLTITRISTGTITVLWSGTVLSNSCGSGSNVVAYSAAATEDINSTQILIAAAQSTSLAAGAIMIDSVSIPEMPVSGTWTSEIYNTVSVSSWTTIDANSSTNGGSIVYEVKVGSNPGAVAARPFVVTNPGAIIAGTTDQIYVQVRETLSSDSNRWYSPRGDDLTINFTQGGQPSQSIQAASWKNRLWIAATTGTATTNNMVLVKSKGQSNAWVPYDLNLGPMVKYNDSFYAAASTCSAIYRLDYGANDNGAAINWYWTSRDEVWGQPTKRKYLLELTSEFRKDTATSVSIGYSRDSGVTFTNSLVNMSGSGRSSDRRFVNGGNDYQYRFRIGASALNASAIIQGLTGWARIEKDRTQ